MEKAVFFDRDGVINIDNGFITDIKQVDLYENSPEIIAFCRSIGFKTFIVTNQAAVARGILTEEKLKNLNEQYKKLVLKANPNAIIDKIYYCPHHPEANIKEYRQACECRKPKAGMILAAQKEFDIDLEKSFLVGDRISDIMAGKTAGCKTIQFLSGKHLDKPIISDIKIDENTNPDFVITNLKELKDIIK